MNLSIHHGYHKNRHITEYMEIELMTLDRKMRCKVDQDGQVICI